MSLTPLHLLQMPKVENTVTLTNKNQLFKIFKNGQNKMESDELITKIDLKNATKHESMAKKA